jgi:ligand-binding sensor domain-containing protein
MAVDEENRLWSFSEGQQQILTSFHEDEGWRQYTMPHHLSSKTVTLAAVSWDQEPLLAIGSNKDGICLLRGGVWSHLDTQAGLLSNEINDLKAFKGRLYAATPRGISIIGAEGVDNSLTQVLPERYRGLEKFAVEVNSEGDATFWLLGRDWVGRIRNHRFEHMASVPSPQSTYESDWLAMLPDGGGGLLLGHSYQLYHLDPQQNFVREWSEQNGLITQGTTDVMRDREGNFWIASRRGVTKMRFSNYDQESGLLEDEVSALVKWGENRYLLGHNHGFTLLEPGKPMKHIPLPEDPVVNDRFVRVLDMRLDHAGNVWAGCYFGVARLVGHCFEAVDDPNILHIAIRKIESDRRGTLYFATGNAGLLIYDGTWRLVSADDFLGNRVYAIHEDRHGTVWVGTLNGLYYLFDNELIPFREVGYGVKRPVYFIEEDHAGWSRNQSRRRIGDRRRRCLDWHRSGAFSLPRSPRPISAAAATGVFGQSQG